MTEALYYRDDIALQSRCLKTRIYHQMQSRIFKLRVGWAIMHVWWKQVYLSYTALVRQIRIAQPACYCQEGLGACSPGKFLKLHALTRMESEGILNIFYIPVFLTLAVHITISYSYLFIYNYFNQSCYCVTFTDLNDPLGSDPVPGWTRK